VAEQQCFEHGFRNRGAIDRDEWLGAAIAALVDELGQHFLAGAGRPVDQDRDVGLRQPVGEGEDGQRFRIGRNRAAADRGQRDQRAKGRLGYRIGISERGAAAAAFDRGHRVAGQRDDIGQGTDGGLAAIGQVQRGAREQRGRNPGEFTRQ
jgi:hypothetical protein